MFFEEIKHILAKPDEEFIIQNVNVTVAQLRFANDEGKAIRLLYEVWLASDNRTNISSGIHKSVPNKKIRKVDFVNFLKHFRDLGET